MPMKTDSKKPISEVKRNRKRTMNQPQKNQNTGETMLHQIKLSTPTFESVLKTMVRNKTKTIVYIVNALRGQNRFLHSFGLQLPKHTQQNSCLQ